jgi:hypothetical protein
MMIIAWMTEVMEYASAGLVGLFLFWVSGTPSRRWFSRSSMTRPVLHRRGVFGTMATKTDCRNASPVAW